MKLSQQEQTVCAVTEVRRGRIPPSRPRCNGRHSDCLVYVLSGEAAYTFGDTTSVAAEGDVLYLAHRSRYAIEVTAENYRYINVDFFFEEKENDPGENEIFRGKSVALLKNAFEKLLRLWMMGSLPDRMECRSLLYGICAELIRSRLSRSLTGERLEKMEELTEHLKGRLSDKELSVASLARRYGISAGHLRRLFWALYQCSPCRYITLLRLQKAKELLSEPALPIAEVADACGFRNHYYFSKVFKEQTGLTPGEYRKRTRAGI